VEVEIEYQDKIPIFILGPNFKNWSLVNWISNYIQTESQNDTDEIIVDLSNCFSVGQNTLNRLTEIAQKFGHRIKKLLVVIPKEVPLTGLKIILLNELVEIYSSKYDAVYDLLNK
jgi:hypothetical protein